MVFAREDPEQTLVGLFCPGFRSYGSSSGRAARSEFWYWMLFSILATAAGLIIDATMFQNRGIQLS